MKYKQGMSPNSRKNWFKKGHLVSEKTKIAISKSLKGKTGNRLGSKHSEETKKKLSLINKKVKHNLSGLRKYIKEHGSWNKGKTKKDDSRIARPWLGKPRLDQRGKNSNFWKGENHKSERAKAMETIEYKTWRRLVFERDNYTCVNCGAKGNKGAYLHADHIKMWAFYPELRFDINNGRTLCKDCHVKTPSYGNKYRLEEISKNL